MRHVGLLVLVSGCRGLLSHLVLRASTASWRHYTFAAPGRAQAQAEPTILDQTAWYPLWPDVPTAENRIVKLEAIEARKPPQVVQSPNTTNQFTAIVELSDEGISGAAYQTVEITVSRQ